MFDPHHERIRIVRIEPLFHVDDASKFRAALLRAGFQKDVFWGGKPMTLTADEYVVGNSVLPGSGSNAQNEIQHAACQALHEAGFTGQIQFGISGHMHWIG